jgi:hypothetical protein
MRTDGRYRCPRPRAHKGFDCKPRRIRERLRSDRTCRHYGRTRVVSKCRREPEGQARPPDSRPRKRVRSCSLGESSEAKFSDRSSQDGQAGASGCLPQFKPASPPPACVRADKRDSHGLHLRLPSFPGRSLLPLHQSYASAASHRR